MNPLTLILETAQTIAAEFLTIVRPIPRNPKLFIPLIILVVAGLWFINREPEAAMTDSAPALPVVTVGTANSLVGNTSVELIGTVTAKTEANLQTEVGGRVVAVRTTLGQRVAAGTVIAQIENASEQAAVLQAEGAYEAALAAAAQSQVGTAEAETALRSAEQSARTLYSSAYNTVSGLVRTDIDVFFSNPNSPLPGLRINGYGTTQQINSARVALRDTLTTWQQSATQNTNQSAEDIVRTGSDSTAAVITLVDYLLAALARDVSTNSATEAETRSQVAALTATRSTLLNLQNNFTAKQAELANAQNAVTRAAVAASRPDGASAADAQIKQALGVLRAAQANLAKTIVRTPISGTVNTLSIKTGDFVAPNTPVAVITNDDGVEVTTFLGERDLPLFPVGSTVLLRDRIPATVTNVSSGIDATTGKVEIRIATDDTTLKAGDTVRVTRETATSTPATDQPVLLPLAAVKFAGSESYVFVVEDNKLARRDVTTGDIRGELIHITSGVTGDTPIVLDARGKTAGSSVTVITQ